MKTGKDITSKISEEQKEQELKEVKNKVKELLDTVEKYQNKEKEVHTTYSNYHKFWMELQDFIAELEDKNIDELKTMVKNGAIDSKLTKLYKKHDLLSERVSTSTISGSTLRTIN